MGRWLDAISWWAVAVACATLGLAPFLPVPHFVEKLGLLARGELVRAIDWFDLLFHGWPWALLTLKAARLLGAWRRGTR